MLRNYFKISFRNIIRSLSYSVINISGLTLGITCALLIFSLITYHLSFDNFHKGEDRIFRFVTEQHRDQVSHVPSVPPAFGHAFRNDYSFGEKVARLCTLPEQLVTIDNDGQQKKFKEEIAFAEPDFFEIFNFPLIEGQRIDVLSDPYTAIITEKAAKKYFGTQSALNKMIRFDNSLDFKIVGIIQDLPDNTDFRTEIYFSYATIGKYNEWFAAEDSWGGITSDIRTYTRLQPGVDPAAVEKVLPAYVKKYRPENKNVHHYKLQPLRDVHFNPLYQGVMSKTTLRVLAVIGIFLIISAALNFINLATAQAGNRCREIGVRKVLGSARSQLFWQFTMETGVIVIISSVLAFCIAYAVLPYVNTLFNTRVTLHPLHPQVMLFIVTLGICVTFLAGSYPGLVLSGFKPVLALKGRLSSRTAGGFNLRRVLITTQFAIAQVLLIGLIVILFQMNYFKQVDMGFTQDAIIMIPLGSRDAKTATLKNQFLQIPNVENASLCFAAPASNNRWGTSIRYDSRTEDEDFAVSFKGADENFLSTFDIKLTTGRNLSPSDTVREFLVNELLVKKLNVNSPEEVLGKTIFFNGKQGIIVGVVQDFHDQSLRAAVNPVIIASSLEHYHEYGVKIRMSEASTTLRALENAWSAMYPELMFEYHFLDQQTAAFYEAEQTMLQLIQVFSFIALFIGCLGLYGLVSFMAEQKTKEIGIRKVLGGSISHILWIFGREFFRLIIIAFVVAAPLGWYIMSQWLENYEYRFTMTGWIFVLELGVISLIALLTVGFRSAQAAMLNPVHSLRAE